MNDLLSLLDTILGTHQRHAHDEYYFMCAFCHHKNPKLAININSGRWQCWVCSTAGRSLYSLLKKLDCSKEQFSELSKILNDDFRTLPEEPATTTLFIPKEYIPLWEPSKSIDYKNAIRYLTQRNITSSDILRYQIGYCTDGIYKDRIIVPSFDEDGKLNYFVGRSFYENSMKYKNPKVSKDIIGFDFHINWNYSPVLCEGVYDAMAIKRNAIPLLGKSVPPKLFEKIRLKNVSKIYLALDNDALKSTSHIAEQFMRDGRSVYRVFLDGKDPSEIGFNRMCELIEDAKPMNFVDIINLRVSTT